MGPTPPDHASKSWRHWKDFGFYIEKTEALEGFVQGLMSPDITGFSGEPGGQTRQEMGRPWEVTISANLDPCGCRSIYLSPSLQAVLGGRLYVHES